MKKLHYKTVEHIFIKRYRGKSVAMASIYKNHYVDGSVSYTFIKHVPDTKRSQKTFTSLSLTKAYAGRLGFDYK